MNTKFNLQALLECIASLGLGLTLMHLILTNQYINFVHPRHEFFLWLLAILLLLWSVLSGSQMKLYHYKKSYSHLLTLAIPLFIFLLPLFNEGVYSQATADVNTVKSSIKAAPFGVDPEKDPAGILIEDKEIVLNTKNYYRTVLTMTNRVEDFQDYDIIMTGYVSKHDKTLKDKDFFLSRVLMICCAADVAPFGLPCQYKGKEELHEGQWIMIKGKVSKRNYHGLIQPYIIIEKVAPAAPIPGYIYP